VNKLKACGLLGADLLHTVNGREYVTQKQLRQDIKAQLQRAGGRVAVRARRSPQQRDRSQVLAGGGPAGARLRRPGALRAPGC
jgi:hypothetical protein